MPTGFNGWGSNINNDEDQPKLPPKPANDVYKWEANLPAPNPLDNPNDRKVEIKINDKPPKRIRPWF